MPSQEERQASPGQTKGTLYSEQMGPGPAVSLGGTCADLGTDGPPVHVCLRAPRKVRPLA